MERKVITMGWVSMGLSKEQRYTYADGRPPQRLMVSFLKYFIAPFKDEGCLLLLSIEKRWSQRLDLGLVADFLLLNK